MMSYMYLLQCTLTHAVPEVGTDHVASRTTADKATVGIGAGVRATGIVCTTLIQVCVTQVMA